MTAELTIERILEYEGEVYGVCEFNNTIFVESAPSLDELKDKMRELAMEFEGVTIEDFEVIDITDL